MLDLPVEIRQEQSRIRPIDNPRIIGSNGKMAKEFGWRPDIGFEYTLRSLYDYWDQRVMNDANRIP
jgi:nucleoside-diphosphate-sugar epimerase